MAWGTKDSQSDAAPEPPAGVPHYVTDVNKGSINMLRWQARLNEMHDKGYRLAHVFEQDGNTVQVFELRSQA